MEETRKKKDIKDQQKEVMFLHKIHVKKHEKDL